MEIVLDIETVGNITKKQILYEVKKKEFFDGFENESDRKNFRKNLFKTAALKPQTGKIVSLCLLTSNDKEYSFAGDNEKKIIRGFSKLLDRDIERVKKWISFNGKKFDWPFVTARAAVHGIELLPYWCSLIYPFEFKKHFDVHQALKGSLESNCLAFGLEPKLEPGWEVEKLFKQGKFKRITRYCLDDCKKTQELYLKTRSYF